VTATAVLDASALLALYRSEPGAETVSRVFQGAAISAVNLCEVLQHAAARGIDARDLGHETRAADLAVVDFTADDAIAAALLVPITRRAGLSLADRACLALAQRLGAPAVTADRAWVGVVPDVEVIAIR